METTGPLSVIGSAVSPVVMISATAILTSFINARQSNASDRVRALLAEYRLEQTTSLRREHILLQVPLFQKRIAHIEIANLLLFLGTVCFVATVIVISAGYYVPAANAAAMPCFLLGVMLMLSGILAEVVEMRLARQTLNIEIGSTLRVTSRQT